MTRREGSDERWTAYYRAVSSRPARSFCRGAARRFEKPGLAIDLGCGAGIETRDLLAQGWRVLAVDRQADAIERLRRGVPPEHLPNLETRVAPFDASELPPADFIWAGLSLPFCPPTDFATAWEAITTALVPGGRFAGDFFGSRHGWADSETMTFHTREEVEALARGWHVEYIQEGEGECPTALDGIQPWHMFSVQLRKPNATSHDGLRPAEGPGH